MSLLQTLIPAPLVSVSLLIGWLVLARSAAAGQFVLGLVLALGIPLVLSNLRVKGTRVRRPDVVVRLVIRVAYDVFVSNLVIANDLIRWRWRRPSSRFVVIPLELRDPVGLAALALVTTNVPGTVWCELAADRSALLLHVWDAPDDSDFIVRFKARYEQPLREIFE